MNEHALVDSADDVSMRSRESGIVDRSSVDRSSVDRSSVDRSPVERSPVDRQLMDRQHVEREASPVASAVQSGPNRDEDIDITTDDGLEHSERAKVTSLDDVTIEIADDEIETAEAVAPVSAMRSRPPAPPSSRPRPRMPSISGLPPPRSSRPIGIDPWALANKTLELSRANARLVELEELVAFRDAHIVELEANLAVARRKLEDLELRLSELRLKDERSAVSGTRPAVLPASVVDGRGDMASDGDNDGDEPADDADRDSEVGTGSAVARDASKDDASEDDLQQISGIGPRFEAALRRQGITRLSQIAAWSDADVRQVAKALKIPKSRIVKGRWVEVAREVMGTRAASE
jgi:predicted flap endonuclease-1-like 5' DNA nuclease/uncharacterized coiled-coil protein SlyX